MSANVEAAEQVIDADLTKSLVNKRTLILRRFFRNKPALIGTIIMVLMILLAIFGHLINGRFDSRTPVTDVFGAVPPDGEYWLGTNQASIDVWALTIDGIGISLMIGFIVGISTSLIAAVYGSALAYCGAVYERFGKLIDKVGLLFLETLIMVPTLLLVAILMAGSTGGWGTLCVVLVVFGWMYTARLIRGMSYSLVEREFVKAARYMGVPGWKIILRHLVPNMGSLLVLDITRGIFNAIISEVAFSFIGIGIKLPDTSLGVQISQASDQLDVYPWLFWVPVLTLTLITTSLFLVNDGLRDALDPNSNSGGKA
ncbi:ABC transporter permease [Psychromicrobium lacuslunae]|uniref:Oligopeptide transport system permease protein OppC n=1 Tax=Psychromicrobium lacuslunae TaxID=1618207 RepID=A0A0D4C0I1_9MICC|nr:ABC transporter permease [Psychromicrobium lacuslunae]AJT42083.1 hypothetical protein UM93_12250 [Psychromicrobium lacuslunae]